MKPIVTMELEKTINKNKINLYISIILFLIILTLLGICIYLKDKNLPKPTSMNSLITSKNLELNKYAYIDINTKPYLFATYETDGIEEKNKFYLTMDKNNLLYIIYMNSDTYSKLTKNDLKEKTIRIYGLTEKIEDDIKQIAIESYNEILQEQYLTNENFKDYVGLIYLNLEKDYYDVSLFYIGMFLVSIFFIIFICLYFSNKKSNLKVLNKYTQEELNKIAIEIEDIKINSNSKLKLYFLKDYIVDLSSKLIILKYEDIIWIYPYEYRQNGLLINKNIKVMDKGNKLYDICNTKLLNKNRDEVIKKSLEEIKLKNQNVLVGFTNENKDIIKNKKKDDKLKNNKKDNNKKDY